MEASAVRMTRSRAKALGTTPMAAAAPTPEPKTTGRRGRRGAAAAAEQPATALEKQLFQDEPATEQQAQQQVPAPEPSLELPAPVSSEQKQESTEPAEQASAELDSEDKEASHELHTDSNVLMASPIPMTLPVQQAADTTAAPEEVQPLPLHLEAAEAEPPVAPSPAPAPQPSPLQAAAQPPASPLPIPMSPMAFDMQHAPSPAQVAAAAAASPMPAGTPMSFMSDQAPTPGQPGGLSMPATPLSINSIADAVDAAEFSPMPDDDEELGGGSPISLSGEPIIATPVPMQQQDADMADNATPAGNMQPAAVEENPLTFASDRPQQHTPMADPSPMAGFLGMAPASVPHPAAAAAAAPGPRLSVPAPGFIGFSPLPMHVAGTDGQVESPSLDGLIAPAAAGASPSPFSLTPPMPPLGQLQDVTFSPLPGAVATPIAGLAPAAQPVPSPLQAGAVPPVPAPTPAGAAAPAYALAQTPLVGAIAEMQPAAAEEEEEQGDMAMEEDCDMGEAPAEEEEQQPSAPTPAAAARTPAAAASKTPAATTPSARTFTPKLVSTASKATPQAKTPATAAAKSPYVNVESRYNKPRTPAAVTPVAPVAAATTKSTKRVSITTPEGPRSTAPQRQVVPTPYRPKSAAAEAPSPLPVAEPAEEVQQRQAPAVTPEAAAEERRAKAAERLKSIHDAETGAASVPSYLAPTQAFANKAAGKALKSKVETGDYDPRSLRQLKREVKEAIAKKAEKAAAGAANLSAPRDVKLTPKVAERELPMPDDQEDSDHEAEYNAAQENVLVEAMGGLEVAPPANKALPLRGLPAPQGRHLRFDDKGKAAESPQRTVLRGLPVASGKYKRFD
ncbi:hypothetical protein HYH02_004774 [Chlamydomonas schloesseri]|uniref:Uncharacterized protein n=1 Tax=Chlamydomonas schloesseri TaxID=2026947 RepID=A0A836B838_9CHLO|nr:hypothetical protein HYH02_004774 [Chlamydomonas schloesseri]|eukprot:KAG2450263.1 hypothetical protein HYH02_004774 [Chlamydomonas schloesseri]